MTSPEPAQNEQKPPTLWQVCKSVAAALFGVQSEQTRLRDFSHHNPLPFIAVGVLFIIALVLTIALIVSLVVKAAG